MVIAYIVGIYTLIIGKIIYNLLEEEFRSE